jgi:hypothetical protein
MNHNWTKIDPNIVCPFNDPGLSWATNIFNFYICASCKYMRCDDLRVDFINLPYRSHYLSGMDYQHRQEEICSCDEEILRSIL